MAAQHQSVRTQTRAQTFSGWFSTQLKKRLSIGAQVEGEKWMFASIFLHRYFDISSLPFCGVEAQLGWTDMPLFFVNGNKGNFFDLQFSFLKRFQSILTTLPKYSRWKLVTASIQCGSFLFYIWVMPVLFIKLGGIDYCYSYSTDGNCGLPVKWHWSLLRSHTHLLIIHFTLSLMLFRSRLVTYG